MTLELVATIVQDQPIYAEATLRNFEGDAVVNFIDKVVDELPGSYFVIMIYPQ